MRDREKCIAVAQRVNEKRPKQNIIRNCRNHSGQNDNAIHGHVQLTHRERKKKGKWTVHAPHNALEIMNIQRWETNENERISPTPMSIMFFYSFCCFQTLLSFLHTLFARSLFLTHTLQFFMQLWSIFSISFIAFVENFLRKKRTDRMLENRRPAAAVASTSSTAEQCRVE